MLVNQNRGHVKFISYTGRYPNLCRGVLILEIDGKPYVFGHDYDKDWEHDGNFKSFWSTGGNCGFTDSNYSDTYTTTGEWMIDVAELPEEIRQYAAEIDEEFNANVTYGCCGGCI